MVCPKCNQEAIKGSMYSYRRGLWQLHSHPGDSVLWQKGIPKLSLLPAIHPPKGAIELIPSGNHTLETFHCEACKMFFVLYE